MHTQTLLIRRGTLEQHACFAIAKESDLQRPELAPASFLSDSESARLRDFQFLPKKQSFLLGRLAAKKALAESLGETDLRRINIRPGSFDQPVIHHPKAALVDVTVSHSHGVAVALAFPRDCPMGIDLETVSESSAETILEEMMLSDQEKKWRAQETLGVTSACGVLWTAREALGKLLKIGLNCPMNVLSLGKLEPIESTTWVGHYVNFSQCKCVSLTVDWAVMSIAMPRDVELDPLPAFI